LTHRSGDGRLQFLQVTDVQADVLKLKLKRLTETCGCPSGVGKVVAAEVDMRSLRACRLRVS
ncbi:hypothetical protein ABZX75_34210, partial [Streptomyces sp. NPDC003038]|uniref:hypothetical protein n=1 Tax=Streptomyces sp. NPDC003038 TaxID=3154546 RepID=UPI0033A427F8